MGVMPPDAADAPAYQPAYCTDTVIKAKPRGGATTFRCPCVAEPGRDLCAMHLRTRGYQRCATCEKWIPSYNVRQHRCAPKEE